MFSQTVVFNFYEILWFEIPSDYKDRTLLAKICQPVVLKWHCLLIDQHQPFLISIRSCLISNGDGQLFLYNWLIPSVSLRSKCQLSKPSVCLISSSPQLPCRVDLRVHLLCRSHQFNICRSAVQHQGVYRLLLLTRVGNASLEFNNVTRSTFSVPHSSSSCNAPTTFLCSQ